MKISQNLNPNPKLGSKTWIEVDAYLKTNTALILPIGSTEQHGPTGMLGTDFLTANAVAESVGSKLNILVAPVVAYGMAAHHMQFAGSASLRPSVYQAMLADIFRSFYAHGFRRFFVINGHGGNEYSVRATFQELKAEGFAGASFSLYNWWKMPEVSALADELYGKKEGFHATPSEVSLTFHLEGIERRDYTPVASSVERSKLAWPLNAKEIRSTFSDGTMQSDPGLACAEHGVRFLRVATDAVCNAILTAPHLD